MQKHYKNNLSGFKDWDQKDHAEDWLLFEENLNERLGLDETSLSNCELFTILINKAADGLKGSIVAIIKGTKSENIITVHHKIDQEKRSKVKEVTVDMVANTNLVIEKCFSKAKIVTDRFHVQKLAQEAVQEDRIV